MSYFPTITAAQISDSTEVGRALIAFAGTDGFIFLDTGTPSAVFAGTTETIDAAATPNIAVDKGLVTGASA